MTKSLDNRTKWLDMALEDQPAEVKARVLAIILKYGIDPDNEFFMIFCALGQLQVLIEDSPQEWQTLFKDFQGELTEWTQTNLETLEIIAQKSATMAELAETSNELGDILKTLVNTCNGLMQHLKTSDQSLMNFMKEQKRWSTSLSKEIHTVKTTISHLESISHNAQSQTTAQINALQTINKERKRWLMPVIVILAMGYMGWQNYAFTTKLEQIKQKSDWQFQNVLRIACRTGAKEANSPECLGLGKN